MNELLNVSSTWVNKRRHKDRGTQTTAMGLHPEKFKADLEQYLRFLTEYSSIQHLKMEKV